MKVRATHVFPWTREAKINGERYYVTVEKSYGDEENGIVIFSIHDQLRYVQARIDGKHITYLMEPIIYYSPPNETLYYVVDPTIAYIIKGLKTELDIERIGYEPDYRKLTLDYINLEKLLSLNNVDILRPYYLFYSKRINSIFRIKQLHSFSIRYDLDNDIGHIFSTKKIRRVDEAVDDHTGDELVTLLNRFKGKIAKALKVLLNTGSAEILSFDPDGAYVRTEDGIYHVPYAL